MTTERMRQIERLFGAALRMPAEDRPGYLERECPDADARDEVAALLDRHDEAFTWFDELAADVEASLPGELARAGWAGRRVGPYRTVERIGRGGMGTVFLAERADGQFEQRVALKLLRRGVVSDEAIARFLSERRILAQLEHPNIARLLDGGVTEDGMPYFAMELVDGTPLTPWCDERRLSVDERLALFTTVADTVQHLHRNLVVHRDLKPSNILVDPEGVVKVLDFGIAKLLSDDEDAGLTRTGTRALTPSYAAPEQVRGESVTTAADVHALGAILYELMSGLRPFGRPGDAALLMERAVLEVEPEAPSRVVSDPERAAARSASPRSLARRLAGDVDTICLTALRKAPERRYGSAQRMSDDVRANLAGLPISARPDSLAYRVGRFLARHRVGVAAAAVVVLLVVGATTSVALQSRRVARERDRAERVSSLLVDLLTSADPGESRGREVTAREILDRGRARVTAGLEEQPEVKASLLAVLGRTYGSLGLFDEARPLFEEALDLRRRALGDDDPDTGRSRHDLGEALVETGAFEEALEHFQAALEVAEERSGRRSAEAAVEWNGLGRAERGLGRFERAERHYRRALDIRRSVPDLDPLDVSQSLNNLAGVLGSADRHEEAVPLLREAGAIRSRLLGDDHPATLTTLSNMAVLLERGGRLEEAEETYRRVLDARIRLLGPRHPSTALSMSNLANLLLTDETRAAEAEALHRQALSVDVETRGEGHPVVGQRYHSLGRAVYAQGRRDEAEALFRRSLALLREALPEGHVNTAYPMTELGQFLLEEGRVSEALALLGDAVRLRREGFPDGHYRIAEAESALGEALILAGRPREAEPLLLSARSILKGDARLAALAERNERRIERLR